MANGNNVLELVWIKCGDRWCDFWTVNLQNVNAYGVYVIWRGGPTPAVVRVGQGDIAERIAAHRNAIMISAQIGDAPAFVTWASVPLRFRDGVERYLADRYGPLVGEAFPAVAPIQVNLPE